MEFIKRMKKREFIEFGLKAAAGLILAFVAVILMEGMIYSITLNAYRTKGENSNSNSDYTIAYCIETDKENDNGEDLYFVLNHNPETDEWSAVASDGALKTKAQLLADQSKKELVWHAPSAFTFTITPVHYVVITIFMAGVAGFFAWRFVKLSASYKDIENTFKKTGAIEISNI